MTDKKELFTKLGYLLSSHICGHFGARFFIFSEEPVFPISVKILIFFTLFCKIFA